MTVAKKYIADELQFNRPQPMYDRKINQAYREIFHTSPVENLNLLNEFKNTFVEWLHTDKLNTLSGIDNDYLLDACIGCTQYIDDLYQSVGSDKLMIFAKDYTYHLRLNSDIKFTTLETLEQGKELLIAMPFPYYGDIHPQMSEILSRCLELNIPVHIDGAWIGGSRNIEFDFSHPAIKSFAISLSKALGIGGNRVGIRFTRQRTPGSITIMNDFNMNCQSLLHIGLYFMNNFPINFFWNKYEQFYEKICTDFGLTPTKAIHIAHSDGKPVGLRPLLRYLGDK